MKHPSFRLLVLSSCVCATLSVLAAQRPRYGGTLRVEMQAAIMSLEPATSTAMAEPDGVLKLRRIIYDRLVGLDVRGQSQPALAASWQHDQANTHWSFKLRIDIKWHDGAPLTPGEVLTSLQDSSPGMHLQLLGDTLAVSLDDPRPDLPILFATHPGMFIRRKSATPSNTPALGTGPFRVLEWRAGSRVVLQANEDYWGGRPYLDNIDVLMGRSSRDQLIDLELDKADLVELDPGEARRLQQEGKQLWASAPIELVSLQFDSKKAKVQDQRLREAIALAIDREAIHKVILQNYGEATASLFPQWLSGYSFLFTAAPDLDRARKRISDAPKPPPIRVGYDPADLLLRQIVERVAVNVRDVGIVLEPTALPRNWTIMLDNGMDITALRTRIQGPTLSEAVGEAASVSFVATSRTTPEEVYVSERQFLSNYTHVPLVYIPELVGSGPHLRGWNAPPWGDWHLDDLWLGASKP